MGFWSRIFGSSNQSQASSKRSQTEGTFSDSRSRQERFNSLAYHIVIQNQAWAVMESKRRALNEDERLDLFINASLQTIDQLMDQYGASLDEAIDAYRSTSSGRSWDRQMLKDLISSTR